ncbi:MAG: TolC family protein [Aureliella sp.]
MSRLLFRWIAVLQIGLVVFTGCHPTQPFFVARDESRADYIAQSMGIEYADVQVESLPEATLSQMPIGPGRDFDFDDPNNFIDLTLEDCISIALQNTKILRVLPGSNTQTGSVAAQGLSSQPGTLPSTYDVGLLNTTASTQPLTIDGQGNRIPQRGLIRSNQIGGVEDALSEFDAQFSALFGYNTTDRPRNVGAGNVFNPQFFQAVDANGQWALSKRLATGTVATLRGSGIYSRNNIPAPGLGRNVPSDYTLLLQAQVTQPLLRGRGTLINRLPIMLARINEDIELHRFEANVRNLVKDVENAYWDLHCAYLAFEAAKTARDSALNLWRVAQTRLDLESGPPEAEAQARALLHQFEAQLHAALYGSRVPGLDIFGVIGRNRILREKMGLAATDGKILRPSESPTVARIHFDWNDILAEALTRNTELRQHKWAIKQRELEIIGAKNQILPQLDASLTASWVGVGDHLAASDRRGIRFPNPGSTALDELTGGDYQEYGARLEFTPNAIGSRRANANIQNARIQLVKFKEELKEKELYLVHELDRAYTSLEATYVSIQDHARQLVANSDEIRVYNERIENDAGELAPLLDSVLRAEERRSRAELLYYQAVCEYNKAMVDIHYLKGSLLDLNNVALAEGPWVDKAYWDAEERASERASGIYFDYGYTRPGVISNGPVEAGMVTEGNITVPGSSAVDTRTREDFDLDDGEVEDGEMEFRRPRRDAPTAFQGRGSTIRSAAVNGGFDSSAQLASGSISDDSAGSVWGSMGLDENSSEPAPIIDSGRAQPIPTTAPQNGSRTIPATQRSSRSSSTNAWRSR